MNRNYSTVEVWMDHLTMSNHENEFKGLGRMSTSRSVSWNLIGRTDVFHSLIWETLNSMPLPAISRHPGRPRSAHTKSVLQAPGLRMQTWDLRTGSLVSLIFPLWNIYLNEIEPEGELHFTTWICISALKLSLPKPWRMMAWPWRRKPVAGRPIFQSILDKMSSALSHKLATIKMRNYLYGRQCN